MAYLSEEDMIVGRQRASRDLMWTMAEVMRLPIRIVDASQDDEMQTASDND
jgi:hypothetical protein